MKIKKVVAAAVALTLSAGASYACDAVDVEDAFDLDEAASIALYECLEARMAEGLSLIHI